MAETAPPAASDRTPAPAPAPATPAAAPHAEPSAPPPAPPLAARERPQQRRSKEKVARIKAATMRLLDTRPYGEITTKHIAAEAGISVGALYRYFPDKEAVAAALAREFQDSHVTLVARHTAERPPGETVEGLIRRLVAAFAERFRTEPGFRSLWLAGPPRLPEARELSDGANARVAALVHRALSTHYGLPATDEAERRVAMAVDALDDLLQRAFREDPRGDDWVLTEAARMMALYLTTPPKAENPSEHPIEEPTA
ncbi:TetR/AcrR family transcriptional regulator [Streptomyces sp. NPDC088923]|uniref:TetR/AcrR family transcriptional regulator n=1 Tax=Streptomyces sp. NPDC088923 TaxID=3365913 RepID=UPI0038185748